MGAAAHLTQRVAVGAGLGVGDRAQRHAAVCAVGARGHYVVAFKQLEGKLISGHVASRKLLRHRNLIGHARNGRLHGIRVGEGERRIGGRALALHRQLAVAVVGHLEAHLFGGLRVISHAIGRAALRHLVGEDVRAGNASPGGRFVALRLVGSVICGIGIVRRRLGRSCTLAVVGSHHSTLALSTVVGIGSATLLGVGLAGRIGVCCAILALCALAALSVNLGSCGVVGICSSGVGRAQSLVQVVERECNTAEINVAVGVVLDGGARRHRGIAIVGRYREGELALDACRGQALAGLQDLDAGKAYLNRVARGVRVLEHQTVVARISRCDQRAIAVVDNRHREVDRLRLRGYAGFLKPISFLVGNVINSPLAVLALFGFAVFDQLSKRFGAVAQRAEVDRAVRSVLRTKKVVATCKVLQREAELAVGQAAAGKRLSAADSHIAFRLIRVGERKGYGVGLRRIGSAHIGSRRFAAGYRGGYREFASVGNGYLDSYRVDSAIVGITRLTSVNLGNFIGVGLARIALGEHHVVTQNPLQHLIAVGSRRHCELITALSQTEHIGRFRVGGRYRNLELAFDHIAALQDLRQLDAAIGGVADACRVLVNKRAVFSRSRSGEFAFAVINNRYRNSGLVGCVIDAFNSARGFGYFVLKCLGRSALQHVGSVGDVAETEVLGIRLGHSCSCHAINRSFRHGRTIGKRFQVEGEAIGIQPIPALQDLL